MRCDAMRCDALCIATAELDGRWEGNTMDHRLTCRRAVETATSQLLTPVEQGAMRNATRGRWAST